MSDLEEIMLLVKIHHEEHPDHGIDCACQDKWIGHLRKITTLADPGAQQRLDYILRTAINNRIQNNDEWLHEFGIFGEEWCLEGGYKTRAEAETALKNFYKPEDEVEKLHWTGDLLSAGSER